jgi:hypothetical protein
MKEKIIKDKITLANLLTDAKEKFKATIRISIIAFGGALILFGATLLLFIITDGKERLFALPLLVITIISLYIVIAGYTFAIRDYLTVRKKNFTVVKEKLVEKEAEIHRRYHSRPNTLIFKNYDKHFLTEYWHYSFSAQYKMFDTELFRTSDIGDEFYLIVNKKNKILLVYNTKYFELEQQ